MNGRRIIFHLVWPSLSLRHSLWVSSGHPGPGKFGAPPVLGGRFEPTPCMGAKTLSCLVRASLPVVLYTFGLLIGRDRERGRKTSLCTLHWRVVRSILAAPIFVLRSPTIATPVVPKPWAQMSVKGRTLPFRLQVSEYSENCAVSLGAFNVFRLNMPRLKLRRRFRFNES